MDVGSGRLHRGSGSLMSQSSRLRGMATRADISLSPPSALYHCSRWQVSRDNSARVRPGLSLISRTDPREFLFAEAATTITGTHRGF